MKGTKKPRVAPVLIIALLLLGFMDAVFMGPAPVVAESPTVEISHAQGNLVNCSGTCSAEVSVAGTQNIGDLEVLSFGWQYCVSNCNGGSVTPLAVSSVTDANGMALTQAALFTTTSGDFAYGIAVYYGNVSKASSALELTVNFKGTTAPNYGATVGEYGFDVRYAQGIVAMNTTNTGSACSNTSCPGGVPDVYWSGDAFLVSASIQDAPAVSSGGCYSYGGLSCLDASNGGNTLAYYGTDPSVKPPSTFTLSENDPSGSGTVYEIGVAFGNPPVAGVAQIDGSSACKTSNATSLSCPITTHHTFDIVDAFLSVGTGASSITVRDTSGLTWVKRASVAPSGGSVNVTEWYAKSPDVLTHDLVTVQWSNAESASVVVYGVAHANYTSPFDTNGPWKAGGSDSGPIVSGVSTSSAPALIVGMGGINGAEAYPIGPLAKCTAASGYTMVNSTYIFSAMAAVEYNASRKGLSDATVSIGSCISKSYGMIAESFRSLTNASSSFTAVITNMEAGNYLMPNGRQYLFEATVSNESIIGGHGNVSQVAVQFSDAGNLVAFRYVAGAGGGYSVVAGSQYVQLGTGSASATVAGGAETVTVVFPVALTTSVLDASNIDLLLQASDSINGTRGFEVVQPSYFNILNKGGSIVKTFTGNATSAAGGSGYNCIVGLTGSCSVNSTWYGLVHYSTQFAITLTDSTLLNATTYPILLTNSQTVATPNPFDQMITVGSSIISSISSKLTSNLGNIRFCEDLTCSTELHAWLESCTGSCSPSATGLIVWVKLPFAIPANGSKTIYMTELTGAAQFDGVYWGEAPQLSGTYGQYDNGAKVFPYYQAWGGLSAIPSAWTSIGGTYTFGAQTTTFAPTGTQNVDGIYQAVTGSSSYAADFYGIDYATAAEGGMAYGISGTAPTSTSVGGSEAEGANIYGSTYNEWVACYYNPGVTCPVSGGAAVTNANHVFTVTAAGTVGMTALDYAGGASYTITSETLAYWNILPIYYGGYANTLTLYWSRLRAAPPDGVMPTATFGTATVKLTAPAMQGDPYLFQNYAHFTSADESYTHPGDWSVTFRWYSWDGTAWVDELHVTIKMVQGNQGGSDEWTTLAAEWYQGTTLVKNSTATYWIEQGPGTVAGSATGQVRVFLDMWYSDANASTTIGGHVNAYYYGMHNNAFLWWSAWSPTTENATFSEVLASTYKSQSSTLLPFSKIGEVVARTADPSFTQYCDETTAGCPSKHFTIFVHGFEINDFQTVPAGSMGGITKPQFVAAQVPQLPQNGFLTPLYHALAALSGAIWSVISGGLAAIWGAMGAKFPWFTAFWGDVYAGIVSFTGILFAIFGDLLAALSFITGALSFLAPLITVVSTAWHIVHEMLAPFLGRDSAQMAEIFVLAVFGLSLTEALMSGDWPWIIRFVEKIWGITNAVLYWSYWLAVAVINAIIGLIP